MKLPSNVKPRTAFLWKLLPHHLRENFCQAIYPNIYIPERLYINLRSNNPNPQYEAIIIHEQTHIQRQQDAGWLFWILKYILMPSFRINEELIAIYAQMDYLKKKHATYDVVKHAKMLSSGVYLWSISYKHAYKILDNYWIRGEKLNALKSY